MRVLVCGSRSWADQGKVEEVLERVTAGVAKVTLVQGDARGADRMAADVARRRGWAVESHPANWRSEGRSAGMARNQRMLLNGRPSFVVAFIDERDRPSPGTRDMVRRARQAGVKGLIVRAEA
jgi:phosphoserine phosphatase